MVVRRRRIRAAGITLLVAALVGATALIVRADILVPVTGQVLDVLGTPIQGASVSDGTQSATTNASGSYTLQEPAGSTVTLTASATNYAPGTKTVIVVPPGATANFSLLYSLNASITPAFFNTAPQTLTLSVTTQAPTNSVVTAALPGGTVTLPFVQNLNGANLFRATASVNPANPGTTSVTFAATRQGTTVGQSTSKSYLFETTPPAAGTAAIEPSVGGTTLLTPSTYPRLILPLSDSGSGIDPDRIFFDLTDPNGVMSTVQAEWDGAKAAYTFGVSAAAGTWQWKTRAYDRAGNMVTATNSFEVNGRLPFVDSPPSVALAATPVIIRAVLPIAANTVRLDVTRTDGTVTAYPMRLEERLLVATIPATDMQPGIVRYRVTATTDSGDVTGPQYEMYVGTDPNPNGLFPGVTATRADQVPLRAWGALDSQLGLSLPDEAAPIAPGAFAVDPDYNRTYILDPVFNRVKAFNSSGTLVLSFSLPTNIIDPSEILVVPQTHEIFVLDPSRREVLRYNPAGTLMQRLTIPQPRKVQPTYPPADSLHTTLNSNGGWNLYVSQGVQTKLYPLFIDGTYVAADDAIAQAIPGLPLGSGLYAKVSFANQSGANTPILGIVDAGGAGAANTTIPLPPLPGQWIPDSIAGIHVDTSVTGKTRLYIPVGVHRVDAAWNITANEWNVFGVDVRVATPPGGIGVPQVTVTPILSAALQSSSYAPHNRIFATAFGNGALYQLLSFETGLRIDRYTWSNCTLCQA